MKFPPNLSFIPRIHEKMSFTVKSLNLFSYLKNQFVSRCHSYVVTQKGCLPCAIKSSSAQCCQCGVPLSDKTKAFAEDLRAPMATEATHSLIHQFIHLLIQYVFTKLLLNAYSQGHSRKESNPPGTPSHGGDRQGDCVSQIGDKCSSGD